MAKKKTYDSIQAVLIAIDAGIIKASELSIRQDNDGSTMHLGLPDDYGIEDSPNEDLDSDDFLIWRGKGYGDTDELWRNLFPDAAVDWV